MGHEVLKLAGRRICGVLLGGLEAAPGTAWAAGTAQGPQAAAAPDGAQRPEPPATNPADPVEPAVGPVAAVRRRVYLLLDGDRAVELELPEGPGAGAVTPVGEAAVRALAERRGGVAAERFAERRDLPRFTPPDAGQAAAGRTAAMRLVVARRNRPAREKHDLVRVVGRVAHSIRKVISGGDDLNAADERALNLEARRLAEAAARRLAEHRRALEPLGLDDPEGCAAYLTLRDLDELVREEDRAATLFFLDFALALVHGHFGPAAGSAPGPGPGSGPEGGPGGGIGPVPGPDL
ncbi:MAG: hypothetical protein H0S85_15025 [Desulfovibrionaceae bacterium]|nr:hypothetical protein [Desulfovibrionaceae bacterium]